MSYTTWHNYGYGICVDDIKTRDVTRLESMLKLAPNLDRESTTGWRNVPSVSQNGMTTWSSTRTLCLALQPFCRK